MRQHAGPNIHIYIERLILDGLPIERTPPPHIQAAIEAELTRLLVENGLASDFRSGIAVPSVHADSIQLAADGNPTQMGTQIARSIYSGIGDIR